MSSPAGRTNASPHHHLRERKRKADPKREQPSKFQSSNTTDLNDEPVEIKRPIAKKTKTNKSSAEQRLKRYRETAPASIQAIYERALSQRMFCLDRQRGGSEDCPTEVLKIAGSTGNVYTVKIDRLPSCDCPHARRGNECKHVLFVLVRVLKATNYWQRAYLASELREIFSKAPPIVPVDAERCDNDRKPIHEEDTCPICFMEFQDGLEGTVYCKAACGNNIHKECFDQWAASRKRSAAPVTCPFCRSRWIDADGSQGRISIDMLKQRSINSEGYINVAQDLGISTQRGKPQEQKMPFFPTLMGWV
ncbi:hypothetical protein, variant 3 [Verruconis gallopava]|uniref:SWIM-type domain-containing protein n=1 Tax=Verruconis gallopava TaxID=253628 RepID=A0A0D2AE65_9PEZI|nr:hypothetical protein, variant 3 [Verruconis gallopava]KIW05278.1 hypothetical protein, variant 3 [Verruconis gallopava]